MSGYPQHRPLRQRDADRGRHGALGEAQDTEVRRGLEAGPGGGVRGQQGKCGQ